MNHYILYDKDSKGLSAISLILETELKADEVQNIINDAKQSDSEYPFYTEDDLFEAFEKYDIDYFEFDDIVVW